MAYSRWGNSIWYTFWLATDRKYQFPTQKLKNEEKFEICDFPSFYVSYGSIKNKGIDNVLNDIKEYYSKEHSGRIFDKFIDGEIHFKDTIFEPKNPTDDEIQELRGYLEKFITDVDEHYKWINYFHYEWYLNLESDISDFFKKFKKK